MTAKAGQDVRVGDTYSLLVEVQPSAVTMEISVEISQKATNKPTTWYSYTLPGRYPKDSVSYYRDTCSPVPTDALDAVVR